MVSHEIDKPLSEYALQDLKDHCKPFKVEVEQVMIANNRARVNFLGKNSQFLKEKFMEYCDDFNTLNMPDNWQKPITNFIPLRKFYKYELDINSADFQRIKGLVSAQFNGSQIKKIEVIQNIDLWETFQTEIKFNEDKQS